MFRKREFILSSAILGLIVFISITAAFYPGKTSVKEVAGIKQSVSVTPTKPQEQHTASPAATRKSVTTPTPTVTKASSSPNNSASAVSPQINSSSSSNASHTTNSSNIPTTPVPTQETMPEQAINTSPTPSQTPTTLTITSNGYCSNTIGAVCPTPTPHKVGASSGNTVILQFATATPTPANTGGDVRVRTGSQITETP
jgi:cytoskeletal protein RodZ